MLSVKYYNRKNRNLFKICALVIAFTQQTQNVHSAPVTQLAKALAGPATLSLAAARIAPKELGPALARRAVKPSVSTMNFRVMPDVTGLCLRTSGPAFSSPMGLAIANLTRGLSSVSAAMDRPEPVLPGARNSMGIIQKYPIIQTVQDYAEAVSNELHSASEVLTDDIKRANSANKSVVVDVVGVGAGPQNAIAMGAMMQQRPDVTVLVFEASNRAGTFDKLGKAFRVNSPELPGLSSNPFPGVPVQPSELNHASGNPEMYMRAEKLGGATILALHYAGTRVVFNQRVTKIEEAPVGESWPARFRIVTQDGLKVYANQVVTASGYGSPVARVYDSDTQDLAHDYDRKAQDAINRGDFKYTPGIETVDTFLRRGAEEVRASNGTTTVLDSMPRRVMVIGSGDGGKIAVEALKGISTGIEKKGQSPRRFEIHWAGQPAKSAAVFERDLGHPLRKERYREIGKHLEGDVKPYSKEVFSIKEIKLEGKPSVFEVTLGVSKPEFDFGTLKVKSGHRDLENVIVDHIIIATGYDYELPEITGELSKGPSQKRQSVRTDISDYTRRKIAPGMFNVGSRLVNGEDVLPIWGVGPVSVEALDGDLEKYTSGLPLTQNAFGPRSAAAGREIAREVKGSVSGLSFNPVVLRADSKAFGGRARRSTMVFDEGTPLSPLPSKELITLESKIRMSRIFDHFRFPKSGSFSLNLSRSGSNEPGKQSLVLSIQGLDESSTAEIAKKLQTEEEFMKMLGAYFTRLASGTELQVHFESRSDGTVKSEASTYVFGSSYL